jgi:hypothetical protein
MILSPDEAMRLANNLISAALDARQGNLDTITVAFDCQTVHVMDDGTRLTFTDTDEFRISNAA